MSMGKEDVKAVCDRIIESAAEGMVGAGAPIGMVIDRLLTYASAQACVQNGSPDTARQFREMAGRIDAGIFHAITGEGFRH